MPAEPTAWAQIIGWSLTAGGIAISLFWNLLNRRHTNKIALEVRVANFRSDQWAATRSKIEAALDNLGQAIEAITISLPTRADADFATKFGTCNLTIVIKHETLAEALRDAAANTEYVTDRAWTDLAFGPRTVDETSWDNILAALAAAEAAETDAATKAALVPARGQFLEIRRVIAAAIRSENTLHDPSPKY